MLRPWKEKSSCDEGLPDYRAWIDWVRRGVRAAEARCGGAQSGCDWGCAPALRAYAGDYAGSEREARASFGLGECAAAAECGVSRIEPRRGCYLSRTGAVSGVSDFAAWGDSERCGLVCADARRGDDTDFGGVWD